METRLNRQMLWNSNVENRLLWKRNKTQKCDEIPWWKRDNCRNAIKYVNVVKFEFRGARQIFNSVEYSEPIVEFLFWEREIVECQLLIYWQGQISVTSSLFV